MFRVPRSAVLVIATLVTLFIVVWNLNFYFHDPNQINLTSDPNTQIANGIARKPNNWAPEPRFISRGLRGCITTVFRISSSSPRWRLVSMSIRCGVRVRLPPN
ncbi:MAG: hypothetical protein R2839_02810 [Thermomicrobiales bacterium]